jgi:hypothetical protein
MPQDFDAAQGRRFAATRRFDDPAYAGNTLYPQLEVADLVAQRYLLRKRPAP